MEFPNHPLSSVFKKKSVQFQPRFDFFKQLLIKISEKLREWVSLCCERRKPSQSDTGRRKNSNYASESILVRFNSLVGIPPNCDPALWLDILWQYSCDIDKLWHAIIATNNELWRIMLLSRKIEHICGHRNVYVTIFFANVCHELPVTVRWVAMSQSVRHNLS